MRRTNMSALIPAILVVVSACMAPATPGSAAKPATQTIRGSDVGSITISSAATADVVKLPFSVDAVWRVLPSVYDSVGVPITTLDQASKTLGNEGYKTRQRLGKIILSRYLDCGNTQIGPNADSYDVFLSVTTTVTADGAGGAKLSTLVDARARPITYNQAYSRCSSKGGIEQRIIDVVNARLGAKAP